MSKIEVDQVDPQSGTNLTLGTSGDSIIIPSGVTLANSGTMTGVPVPTSGIAASAIDSGTIATARLGSGTASSSTFLRGDQTYAAAGGDNTPYFNVYRSSNQTGISDDTNTVAALDQEYYDSDGAYDTSTYRFTPQTAGKYFLWFCFRGVSSDQALVAAYSNIRKNGSNIVGASSASSFEGTVTRYVQMEATTSVIATANGSSDYFDFSFTLDVASGSNFYLHKDGTNAGGYKIIE